MGMVSAVSIALSGLSASALRVGVAANNIANLQSTTSLRNGQKTDQPYTPQQVVQTSDENGGVRATTQDVRPASVTQIDANGQVQVPNVELEDQFVNLMVGGYDFKANLKAFKVQDTITKNLLDIIS